jgi:hypothetical protein
LESKIDFSSFNIDEMGSLLLITGKPETFSFKMRSNAFQAAKAAILFL